MKDPFPYPLPDRWGMVRKILRFTALACLVGSFGWFLVAAANALWNYSTGCHSRAVESSVPLPNPAKEIVDALEAAQYDKALRLVADGLAHHPEIPQIKELSDEMGRDFTPEFNIHCRPHGKPLRTGSEGGGCQVLAPADEFWVEVNLPAVPNLSEASRHYYAYLFLVDSNGDWTVLLPNKTYTNPVLPTKYTVPDRLDFKGRLHPPATPGAEKLFMVVAWWQIPVLENLSAKLAAETDRDKARALGRRINDRLQMEFGAPGTLKGLQTGTADFNDSGGH